MPPPRRFTAAVDNAKKGAASSLAMRVPRLEAELAPPVARHFQRAGYRVWLEVPFNGRIADVIAIKDEEVVAVELKLTNFREAHRQAMAYQVGCHRSFVGLPLPIALDALRRHRHAFETAGTGLMAINMPYALDGESEAAAARRADVRELLPARTHEGRFLPFLADALSNVWLGSPS